MIFQTLRREFGRDDGKRWGAAAYLSWLFEYTLQLKIATSDLAMFEAADVEDPDLDMLGLS